MAFLLRLLLLLDVLGPNGASPPPLLPPDASGHSLTIGGASVSGSGAMAASGFSPGGISAASVNLSPGTISTQHTHSAESLEWVVGDSPIIVTVHVESRAPDGKLTLKVLEPIKGTLKKGETIKLYPAFATGLPPESLVFLQPNNGADSGAHPFKMRRSRDWAYDQFPLVGQWEVVSMDFNRITAPEQILQAVRLAAKHPVAGRPKSMIVRNPDTTGPLANTELEVPVDERVEKMAREWMSQSSVNARLVGLGAIEPFKSPANIELVMRLLADTRPRLPGSAGKWQMSYYYVRARAVDVLRSWDVRPPELPESGPVLQYHPMSISRAQIAVIAILCVVWLLISYAASRWAQSRGTALHFRQLNIAAISLVLAIGASCLWVRSHSRVDELMFSLDQSHHEIASYNGGIQYCVVREWTLPPNTVVGHFDRALHDDQWSIERWNRSFTKSSFGFVVTRGLLNGPARVIHPFTVFRLPYWALLLPLTTVLFIVVFKIVRSIIRAWRGLCRNCGYDLRESSSGKCPECGVDALSGGGSKAGQEVGIGGQAVGM